jgi:hypothetical protein
VTGQRCAAHRRLSCVECAHQRTRTIATNVDPTALEGADVRGDPHAGEVTYWDSTIAKIGLRPHVRVEYLIDAFFIAWSIEFIITVVWLIKTLGDLK